MKYRLWLDDLRQKPENEPGIIWLHYLTAEHLIEDLKHWYKVYPNCVEIDYISLDNDLGEDVMEGYKVLDWLESLLITVPFGVHIHTSNPVARERMRTIIQRNGWKEIR